MEELFVDGGSFAYIVLFGAVVAPLPALVLAALNLARFRVPTALYALWPLGTVLIGLIGTCYGLHWSFEAVALASPEAREPLLANGAAVSHYPLFLAGAFCVPILVASGFLAAMARILRGGEAGSFTPLHAIAPLALAVMAGLVIGLVSWSACAVVGAGGVAIALASIRSSTQAEDRARLASIRLGVAALGATAALLLAWTHDAFIQLNFFGAYANSIYELKQDVVASYAAYTPWPIYGSLAGGAVLMLAGGIAALPLARSVASFRSLAHGLVFVLLWVPLLGAEAYRQVRLIEVRDLIRPDTEKRLEALRGLGVSVPTSTSERFPETGVTLTLSPGQVWLEGAGLETPVRQGVIPPLQHALLERAETVRRLQPEASEAFDGHLLLEADRRVTLGQLHPVLASATEAGFEQLSLMVTRPDGRLQALRLRANIVPDPSDDTNPFPDSKTIVEDDLEGVPSPARFASPMFEKLEPAVAANPRAVLVIRPTGATLRGTAVPDPVPLSTPEDATRRLAALKDSARNEDTLVIRGDDAVTVEQLVAWLDASREDPDDLSGFRPRQLFPSVVLSLGPDH